MFKLCMKDSTRYHLVPAIGDGAADYMCDVGTAGLSYKSLPPTAL